MLNWLLCKMLFSIVFFLFILPNYLRGIFPIYLSYTLMQEFRVNKSGESHGVTELVAAGSLLIPVCMLLLTHSLP